MSESYIVFDHGNADVGDVQVVGRAGHGRQELSDLYEYEVDVEVLGDGGFSNDAIDSLLTNPVRIGFGEGSEHEVHGVIRELEMLSARSAEQTLYRLRIVPKLWYLTLTRRNRVWQDMSYADILEAVLQEHGLEPGTHYELSCSETYPSVEYTVQHAETDFAFVSRLMEHYGIHYHFKTAPDGEVVVFGDDNNVFEPIPDHETLHYAATSASGDDVRAVTSLRRFRRVRPGMVQVRDYNWRTPTTPLRSEHPVDEATGRGLVDLYGDHVEDGGEASDVARIRSEQMMVTSDTFVMETYSRFLFPGARFELSGHPSPDLDQEYVVTAITQGLGKGGNSRYVKTLEAIPAEIPYRPQRRAPWPKLDGLVNGKVDGEARSTMTPIDGDGRYKVVIPGDERGRGGGKASRWVRRAQPSAGSGYGMHLPLHIGTECVIGFVNGDPDRPIIVGAVPNSETASPVTGPNATHSRIRTGSGVVIELDDDC